MASPLVSIIIPAYNAAPWIAESIGSALAQDYEPLEVLIYDGGSTDGTLAVARSFTDPRLRLLAGTDRDYSVARNLLAEAAQGEVIMHQDADDRSLPGRVRRQVAHLLDNGLVFNCCGVECSDGRVWTHWADTASEALRVMATGGKAFAGNSCAYHRRVIDSGLRHDLRWPIGHDLLFEAQVMARFYPSLAAMRDVLYWYRRHPGQIVTRIERHEVTLSDEYKRTRAQAIEDVLRDLCQRVHGFEPQIRY